MAQGQAGWPQPHRAAGSPRPPPPAPRRPEHAGPFVSRGPVPGPAAGPPSARAHCSPDLSAARGAAGGRVAGHFHEKGAAEAPLLAFTACLNCVDIKSRSAVNTQRGPQAAAGGRAGVGAGAAAPACVGSSPEGRERPGVSCTRRAGRGRRARRLRSPGFQPGSAPNSEKPPLLPLTRQAGGPGQAPRGVPGAGGWGAQWPRGRAGVCAPGRLPRAAHRGRARCTGQRERLRSCPPPVASPSPARPTSARRCDQKKESRRSEMETSLFLQPGAVERRPGCRCREGRGTRRRRSPGSSSPGPERSYPSRAGAVAAACRSSAAAASAPSAARSRRLLGARGSRTPMPGVEEGARTRREEPGESPSAAGSALRARILLARAGRDPTVPAPAAAAAASARIRARLGHRAIILGRAVTSPRHRLRRRLPEVSLRTAGHARRAHAHTRTARPVPPAHDRRVSPRALRRSLRRRPRAPPTVPSTLRPHTCPRKRLSHTLDAPAARRPRRLWAQSDSQQPPLAAHSLAASAGPPPHRAPTAGGRALCSAPQHAPPLSSHPVVVAPRPLPAPGGREGTCREHSAHGPLWGLLGIIGEGDGDP